MNHRLQPCALLLLAACASPPDSDSMTLADAQWNLVELHGAALPVEGIEGTPWVQFDPAAMRVHGSSGINRFNGGYEGADDKLDFGMLAMTRRAGPPEAMKLESNFMRALDAATSWRIDGGRLELHGDGELLARFAPD